LKRNKYFARRNFVYPFVEELWKRFDDLEEAEEWIDSFSGGGYISELVGFHNFITVYGTKVSKWEVVYKKEVK